MYYLIKELLNSCFFWGGTGAADDYQTHIRKCSYSFKQKKRPVGIQKTEEDIFSCTEIATNHSSKIVQKMY